MVSGSKISRMRSLAEEQLAIRCVTQKDTDANRLTPSTRRVVGATFFCPSHAVRCPVLGRQRVRCRQLLLWTLNGTDQLHSLASSLRSLKD